jgi:hypothetical protein
MNTQRFHLRVAQLEDQLSRLKRSRDWYRYRYQCVIQHFENHEIPIPWDLRDRRRPPTHDVTEPVEKSIEFIRRCILDGLINHSRRPPPARQFSPELSTFSHTADMYSSHAYRFLREHLALPSENALRPKYATRTSQLQDDLIDLIRIEVVTYYMHILHHFPSSRYAHII